MRIAIIAAIVTVTAGAALAQRSGPELRWQGYVSDATYLYIQGDRVDVEGRSTGAVEQPRARFRSPLPQTTQQVTVNIRRGDGDVEVVEQPSPENEYTAVVRIRPRSTDHQLYDLAFQWDRERDDANRRPAWETRSRTADTYAGGEMTWSGTVDHEALVVVQGRRANVRTVRGRRVTGSDARFASALPRTGVNVRLEDIDGRGNVEIVEQPDARNNYAATVRITDEDDGAGQYGFRLVWDETRSRSAEPYEAVPYRANPSGILTPSGGYPETGSLRWSARVDDHVRVIVRGDEVRSTRLAGAMTQNEEAMFSSPLPRANVTADVRLIRGRGEVHVVEQPSARNGYQLVLEIVDSSGGADDYELEVNWR